MPDGCGFVLSYALKHLAQKDKVRFYYALKGRDGKTGAVKAYSLKQLGKGALCVSQEFLNKTEEFLSFWKCKYAKEVCEKSGKDPAIITYSLLHLAQKDKVRFYYALKGRDGKTGIIKSCQIKQLAKGVLQVTKKNVSQVIEFLQYWKCSHKIQEVAE
ncbi:MAG: hypothetical protein Q7K43_00765, partial [Candidatus Woesearchaeota archaeon]|nr:hypothetical protein [Candidatus Woesearchaeota archaeon]